MQKWLRSKARLARDTVRDHRRKRRAVALSLCDLSSAGPTRVIDGATVATVHLPPVFELCRGGQVDVEMPRLELTLVRDAVVSAASDVIVTPHGAIWEKQRWPQFSKSVPLDSNLVAHSDERVMLDRARPGRSVETGFSLCGTHAQAWSHFLVQYLPKLILLPQIAAEHGQVIVLTPAYLDPQILQIVQGIVDATEGARLLQVKPGEAVGCKVLAHVPHTSYISDHADYMSVYDLVIPDFAVDSIKHLLVAPALEHMPAPEATLRKLYLIRRGHRTVARFAEIERAFVARGYEMVDPASLSLDAKIALFQTAGVVAGPLSSAFTNLIFCQEGTKALIFAGLQRSNDAYMGMLHKNFAIDMLVVSGKDTSNDIHAGYSIPLAKILQAAEAHGA